MDWQEVCENPQLQDLPFKMELNRWGQIVMSPAKNIHSVLQGRIQRILFKLLGNKGEVIPECSVRTSDNVKVADVAWISPERYEQVKHEIAYSRAPEICIEVISASNTKLEMLEKKDLYLEAGAEEVWLCSEEGKLSFYDHSGELDRSRLIPDFPPQVDAS
jgi:Uma2 family endonuclease